MSAAQPGSSTAAHVPVRKVSDISGIGTAGKPQDEYDLRLAEVLVTEGVIPREQLRDAVQAQWKAAIGGSTLPLSEFLLKKGLVSLDRVKEHLFCSRCQKPTDAAQWGPGKEVVCSLCVQDIPPEQAQGLVVGKRRVLEAEVAPAARPAAPEPNRLLEKLYFCPRCQRRVRLENWHNGLCGSCAKGGPVSPPSQMPFAFRQGVPQPQSHTQVVLVDPTGRTQAIPIPVSAMTMFAQMQAGTKRGRKRILVALAVLLVPALGFAGYSAILEVMAGGANALADAEVLAGDMATDLETKLEHYEKAVRLGRTDVQIKVELVRNQIAQKKEEERKQLEQQEKLKKARSRIDECRRVLKGVVRESREISKTKVAGVIEILKICTDDVPNLADGWILWARALELLGRRSEAAEVIAKAEQSLSGTAEIRSERVRLNLALQTAALPMPDVPGPAGGFEFALAVPAGAPILQTIAEGLSLAKQTQAQIPQERTALLEGVELTLRGEYAKARIKLTEAITADPGEIHAWHYRALGWILTGDNWSAEKDWNEALKLPVAEAYHWFWRGCARLAKRDLVGAIEDLTKAIELDNRNALAHNNRSVARRAMGDAAGAIEDCTRALELNPDYFKAILNRAVAQWMLGRTKQAREDLLKAMEGRSGDPIAYNFRGLAKQAMNDFRGAVEDFSHAHALDPAFASAIYNRGVTRRMMGEVSQAIDDFTKALEMDPRLAAAYLSRGRARAEKGDHEWAIRDFTKALELLPGSAPAFCGRGNSRLATGDLEGALGDYTSAILIDARLAEAYNGRGAVRTRRGDIDGALDDLTRAIELDRRYVEAYINRSRALHREGKVAEVVEDLVQAAEIDPQNPIPYYELGCVYALLSGGRISSHNITPALELPQQAWFRDLAFKKVSEAVDRGFADPTQAEKDPRLEPIRSDIRWSPLLERIRKSARQK